MSTTHPPIPAPRALDKDQPVEDVLERLYQLGERDELTFNDVLRAFGRTAFLPVLMMLGLVLVSPLSGIPLLSTVMGLTIALVSTQLLLDFDTIWLPRRLRTRPFSGDRLQWAIERLQWVAGWLDRISRARWLVLTRPPIVRVSQAMVVVAGLMMPMMEVVPFSSSIIGMAVVILSLAQLTRDGLLLFVGVGAMCIGAAIPISAALAVAQAV